MLDTAVRAVKDLERMGASEAESYIQDSREVIISKKGETWSKRKKKDTCIGLRTLINKKKGFAAGTFPICPLEEIEKASFVLSNNAVADPSWEHLPLPKPCVRPEGIYDEGAASMSETGSVLNSLLLTSRISTSHWEYFAIFIPTSGLSSG